MPVGRYCCSGFRRGARFGETVAEDFVAVQIDSPLKWVAVAFASFH